MGYISVTSYFKQQDIIKQAEADATAQYETMSVINDFTNERLEKLESIRKEDWKNGKNTGSY
jgi:hypothetical protein